ncbi:MAG: TIGR04282 family arsenosugar biosynthesis glycosyltransferase, partial [Chloroflexota bacterium]
MARLAIAVMAKAPIPGEAKTRLGAEIGYSAAAAVYQAFLQDTLDVLDAGTSSLELAAKVLVCPARHHADELRQIVSDDWPVVTQTRPGLMGGIADAFDGAFARGADLAVVTDADSPLALWEGWVHCLAVAARHDVAFGPTTDGGYYLIAARASAGPRLADLLLGTA